MIQKEIIGENTKITGNYWSQAIICNPEVYYLSKFILVYKTSNVFFDFIKVI